MNKVVSKWYFFPNNVWYSCHMKCLVPQNKMVYLNLEQAPVYYWLQQSRCCCFHLARLCVRACVRVCVCVIVGNVALEMPVVAGTITEAVLSTLPGVYVSVCLSVDRFCWHSNVTPLRDAVVKLKMKAEFEGGCSRSKVAGCGRLGSQ